MASNPFASAEALSNLNKLLNDAAHTAKAPKNSMEVYTKVISGLMKAEENLSEIEDSLSTSSDTEKRANASVKHAQVLKSMADVEKSKTEMLKASMDVSTVIFGVFMATQELLKETFEAMKLPEHTQLEIFTLFKEKSAGIRDRVDQKILEVRDIVGKVEKKKQDTV